MNLKRLTLLFLCLLGFQLHADESDIASFEMVWKTIKEKHWDLAGTGVDWDKVRADYLPKIKAAQSRKEARTLLAQVLGELKQSHFRIIEAEVGSKFEELRQRYATSGNAGFHTITIDGRVFVARVEPGAEAGKKGIKIGSEITAVDGTPLAPKVAELVATFKGVAHSDLYLPEVLNGMVGGPVGLTRAYTFAGVAQPITLTMVPPVGVKKDLMNLSGLHYRYESEVLPGNIGYVSFNIFLPDVGMSFGKDIQGKLAGTSGLILDLRGNPGGMGMLAVTVANRLISTKDQRLGQMINAGGTMNFPIFPQLPSYDKPVAVLIDGGSASTSEILAAGLQDLKRGRVFGTRSAGAALPSMIVSLPNGDRFQYAIADYLSFSGRRLEGLGVTPDQETPHTLASMAAGSDAALDAARAWIASGPNLKAPQR